MKRKHYLLLVIVMFVMSFQSIAQQNESFFHFSDDFSGPTLSNWNDMYPGNNNWSVLANELHGFYGLGCGSIYCTQADLILKDQYQPPVGSEYCTSIDFRLIEDDEYPQYKSAVASFSLWESANLKVHISVGDGADYWGSTIQDSIYFYVQKWTPNWSYADVSTQKVKFRWDPNQWHTARLMKIGNKYSVFVDDACIGHYIDSLFTSDPKIGLHNYGTKRWDNFVINEIKCYQKFSDDFSGPTLSNWNDMYPGDNNWSVLINELHGFYGLGCGSIYCTQADLILKDQYQPPAGSDYNASIDFRLIQDDEHPQYKSAVASFSLWESANLKVHISVGDGADYWGSTIQDSIYFFVQKWTSNWTYAEVSTNRVKFRWDPNQWHTAKLVKIGNKFSVFVDDACIGHYIDSLFTSDPKIGLHTYGTKRWDNFTLCRDTYLDITPNNIQVNQPKIYPNPCADYLFVEKVNNEENCHIVITNNLGQKVNMSQLTNQVTAIKVKDYPSGVYYLRIFTNCGLYTTKIVKE